MDKKIYLRVFFSTLIVLGTILGIYIVYSLSAIISILLISVLLVISLEPAVRFFIKLGLGRNIASFISYVLFILFFVVVFTVGLPPVFIQAQKLFATVSSLVTQEFGASPVPNVDVSSILSRASSFFGGIVNLTSSAFSAIFTIFSVLVVSLYISLDWENLKNSFVALFSPTVRREIKFVLEEIEISVGHWVKGQLMLMLAVGSLTLFGLLALGVDYALALALVAGLLEIVPMVGPVVAAFLACIVAFSQSPVTGVLTLILTVIIQQLENNLLVPKIMQKVSGFSPLVILLALLVGSSFFGIVGAIIAVPITMISVIVFKHVMKFINGDLNNRS